MVFTVTTQVENYTNQSVIYIYPGTMDAISLNTFQDGDEIVVVKNKVEKVYLSSSYTAAIYAMINRYGLGENELIDPDTPFCKSAIPIDEVQYYTAKMITPNQLVPNGAMIAEAYGL